MGGAHPDYMKNSCYQHKNRKTDKIIPIVSKDSGFANWNILKINKIYQSNCLYEFLHPTGYGAIAFCL